MYKNENKNKQKKNVIFFVRVVLYLGAFYAHITRKFMNTQGFTLFLFSLIYLFIFLMYLIHSSNPFYFYKRIII